MLKSLALFFIAIGIAKVIQALIVHCHQRKDNK